MAYLIHFTEQSTELSPFDVKSFTLNDGKFIRLAAADAPPRQGQDTAFNAPATDEPNPIILPGKEAENWGEVIDENILKLTENFCSFEISSDPGANTAVPQPVVNDYAIRGQAWYNLTDAHMYVWDGKDWNKQAASRDAIAFADGANTACFLFNTLKDQMFTADSFVQKSGDTMTGFLTLHADPTALNHAATKQYVDNQVAGVSNINLNDLFDVNAPTPANGDIIQYNLGTGQWENVPGSAAGSLPLQGLTFAPTIDTPKIFEPTTFVATGAVPIQMSYVVNLGAVTVPGTATHVNLRTRLDNNGDNNNIILYARQFTGTGTLHEKQRLDPTFDVSGDWEDTQTTTWIHPFNTAANTIEIVIESNRANQVRDDKIDFQVWVEGFYISDQGSPPAREESGFNFLINGDFNYWQRGAGPYAVAAGQFFYTADRWAASSGDATTFSAQLTQEAHVPGEIPDSEATVYLKWAVSSASGASLFAPGIVQRVENSRRLAGRTATISFYARSDLSNTMFITVFRNHGSGGSADPFNHADTFPLVPAWQRFTTQVTFPSMAGLTSNPLDSFIAVAFHLAANTTGEFRISQVQLEQGTVATPFNQEPFADTLAKCERYYQTGGYFESSTGVNFLTNEQYIEFRTSMRAAPTVTGNFITGGSSGVLTHFLLSSQTYGFQTQWENVNPGNADAAPYVLGWAAEAEL